MADKMATLKRAICDKKWLAMLPFLPFVALTETTNGPFMSCLLGDDDEGDNGDMESANKPYNYRYP